MSEKMIQKIILKLEAPKLNWDSMAFSRAERELMVAALRASSPAQEPVTTEPVADIDQVAQSFQKWRAEHTRNFYLPWSSLDERQQEHVHEEVRIVLALAAIPAPPQPGRDAVIEECAQAITSLRQSGAVIFDAKHSGQRGEDRSTALHDAINVVRALTGEPK